MQVNAMTRYSTLWQLFPASPVLGTLSSSHSIHIYPHSEHADTSEDRFWGLHRLP